MIRVTIELIKYGVGQPEVIGVMEIANDGTGTAMRGNYVTRLFRRGTQPAEMNKSVTRTGEVKEWTRGTSDFPRQSYSVWRLVLRCLKSAFPEEQL